MTHQIAIDHDRIEQTPLTEERIAGLLEAAAAMHERYGHEAMLIAWAMLTPAFELASAPTTAAPSPFLIIITEGEHQ